MKNNLFLISLLTLITSALYGQNVTADNKIAEIEGFKNYYVLRIDRKDDLELLSDSVIRVTEVVNYFKKGKNGDGLGKVTESYQSSKEEVFRTYYFNQRGKLFAIIDNIKRNDNSRARITYYFAGGQLAQAIDEKRNDCTHLIDNQPLYNRISKLFTNDVIN